MSSLLLPELAADVERLSLVIEIGGMPVRVHTTDPAFLAMLQNRYSGFVTSSEHAEISFDVHLTLTHFADLDAPLRVTQRKGRWALERGDFRAEWEPASAHRLDSPERQSLFDRRRAAHCAQLVLARQGGFLLHSASAIRNGKAFLFAGVSEAGKTTISRLAPPDATLLTDEISYVRKQDDACASFRLCSLRHSVYRRTGQAGRKCFRSDCCSLPARQGRRESHRPHSARGGRSISAC